MKTIACKDAPSAVGPYCQAMVHGGVVYCSGQIGLKPDGCWAGDGVGTQTKQALENLRSVLTAASSSPGQVIRTTVFLTSMDDFTEVNAIYATFFGEHRPARACVEASRLPKDAKVEVSCIAAVNPGA
jgi:2-iminobutanoate/2-iminopropanoate deaminase